jgi:hypothetical protein
MVPLALPAGENRKREHEAVALQTEGLSGASASQNDSRLLWERHDDRTAAAGSPLSTTELLMAL